MTEYISLGLFVLLPLLLVVLTKTNAAILYFCVASATLLQRFLDPDAARLANSLLPQSNFNYLSLAILIIPIIITTFLFKKTVKSGLLPVHLVVAALAGLTLALASDTFFPSSVTNAFSRSELWQNIESFQTIIVGGGFLLSVACLSFAMPSGHGKKGKH